MTVKRCIRPCLDFQKDISAQHESTRLHKSPSLSTDVDKRLLDKSMFMIGGTFDFCSEKNQHRVVGDSRQCNTIFCSSCR